MRVAMLSRRPSPGSGLRVPRLEYSERFADDLAKIESPKLEALVYSVLDSIELFGGFGSPVVPESIKRTFGEDVRKVAVNPFGLVYTYYPEKDLARVEALIQQKMAW